MRATKRRKPAQIDSDFIKNARLWDLKTGGDGLSLRRITRKINDQLINEDFIKKRKGLNETFKW